MMKILIVDDERLARLELRRMLLNQGIAGEVQEASSVEEAIQCMKWGRPDVIFLDIQMPGGSGFSLLPLLETPRPPVIFTTAHEQFALQAYEEEAVDYLLKPFNNDRLARAVARIPSWKKDQAMISRDDTILLKIGDGCQLLRVEEIEILETIESSTLVHWDKKSGKANKPLVKFSRQLDHGIFFQANRKTLINIHRIKSLTIDDKGLIHAHMMSGKEILFSRRRGLLFQKKHSLVN
jgi:two-component system LytT family response regulator